MKIKAKCKFDYQTIKALTHATLFYKSGNPKKRFITYLVLCIVLLIVNIIAMIFMFDITFLLLLIVALLMFLLECYLYLVLPKIRYKALANMKETENEYTFCDDVVKVVSINNDFNGVAELEYSIFIKLYETSKYFFVFQTQNQVYIVDKSTIEYGTAEEIRNKLLSNVNIKYIASEF